MRCPWHPACVRPQSPARHQRYLAGLPPPAAHWEYGPTGNGGVPPQQARADLSRRCGAAARTAPPHPGTAPRGGRAAGVHLDGVLHTARAGPRPAPVARGADRSGPCPAPHGRRTRPFAPPRRRTAAAPGRALARGTAEHPGPATATAAGRGHRDVRDVRSDRVERPGGGSDGGLLRVAATRPQPGAPRLPRTAHARSAAVRGVGRERVRRPGHSAAARRCRPLPRRPGDSGARGRTPREKRGVRPAVGLHDVSADSALSKTFQHPVVGPVTVNCDVLDITDRDQQVVIYTAEPGSPSAEALQLLSVIGPRHTTGPARPARRPSPSPQSCST